MAELISVRLGTAALEHLAKASPDLVVMELALPDTAGYRILEHLHGSHRHIPVIIYSKISHLDDIKSALNFGVSGYFVKGQDTINDIKRLALNYAGRYV